MIFTILSSRSFIHFFCLSCSAIDSLLCISVYLFFSSFRSLVNTSCIFPILFLRSWIVEIYLYLLQFSPSPPPIKDLSCFFIWDNTMPFHFGWTSLVVQMVKHLPAMWETWGQSLGQEDSLEKETKPTMVLLPGKSHGWRTLVGYTLHFWVVPEH